MAAYPHIRKCFADVLQHGHDKMVADTLELLGFQEGDFTAEEQAALRAFDLDPKVDVLMAAAQRRLGRKRTNTFD